MRIEDDVGYYYKGQQIIVVKQGSGESISLFSAKKDGSVTGYSTQLIQDITDEKYDITAKINCNYFSLSNGMALGVRCGADEWSVPRQGAWYYYALLKNGKTEIGMDYDFWYTPNEVVFACSPALILLKDGLHVNYKSPSAGNSKDHIARQSLLIKTKKCFAFVASVGNLSIADLKAWCLQIEDIQDIIVLDGGGSVCLEDDGKLLVSTSRRVSNCLGFYKPEVSTKKKDEGSPMESGTTSKTTLKGIDISNWQKDIDLRKVDFDFVIAKATEGTSFVDRYCDKFIQTVKAMGKLWGFYHFARPTNSAVAEADFFVANCRSYFHHGIPVLDWEAEKKNDVQWALTWLNRVNEQTGVKPMIYMSESVVNAYDWSPVVAADYGLWVAKYRDTIPDYNYDMSNAGNVPKVKWWKGYAMWQWTSTGKLEGYSGSLDCDVFYGNKDAWLAYAGASEEKPTDDSKDIADLKAKIEALTLENEGLKDIIKDYENRMDRAEKALRGE